MANEFGPNLQDASVNPAAKALPAAAGTANTASIDLGADNVKLLGNAEFFLTTPDLTTTELPDAETNTYALQDSADDSSFTTIRTIDSAKQTGAGGAGDSGDTTPIAIPSNIRRYARIAATGSASIGDQSGKTITFGMRF